MVTKPVGPGKKQGGTVALFVPLPGPGSTPPSLPSWLAGPDAATSPYIALCHAMPKDGVLAQRTEKPVFFCAQRGQIRLPFHMDWKSSPHLRQLRTAVSGPQCRRWG